jgi:N-acetyl-anhydromuramyl-L-alanine amidase AmpD
LGRHTGTHSEKKENIIMKLTRILKEGIAGNDVKYLQNRLKELGYFEYPTATGNFGPITTKSVKAFQKANSLKVDGIVGNKTWYHVTKDDASHNSNAPSSNFPYKPSMITAEGLEIYDKFLGEGEYIESTSKKKTIYLHHTAGGSRPDWVSSSWDRDDKNGKPYRVATAYIIGRRASSNGDATFDGKVFRAFDDKYWAFHLGVSGTNGKYDKNSIGIEVCNYGYCKVVDGKFINYVNREIPANEVVDLGKEFRGYRYWEKYTDEQIESLRKLLVYLMDKYDIEIEHQIYDWDWFDYDKDKLEGEGLRTHVQVRKDKTDMFPQKELIDMLNSL